MMMKNYSCRYLRKILFSVFFLLGTLVFGQVGIQTNSPHASSALDIVATDKGLLIPRVTLTANLSSASPVTAPATGLLVFNTGANQPVGLYFWNGSAWNLFNVGLVNADYWNVRGNAGTTVGTNFIGTTDAEDFATYTNNSERMRFTSGGQGLVGLTTPYAVEDFFTIEGNATEYYALNVFSPNGVGAYISANTIGLISFVNNVNGYPLYAKNSASTSYGGFIVGSNRGAFTLNNHYAGLSSHGDDGIFTLAQDATAGIGIIAGGNNVGTLSTIATGTGGAFTGYHGLYGKAVNVATGVGVIGVGNNGGTYNTTTNGSGGAFTGYHGLISTSTNTTSGTGVIGVGNGGSYYLFSNIAGNGSGGAFTGNWCGVAGWSTGQHNQSIGVYGRYEGGGWYNGIGVYGYSRPNNNRGYGVYGNGRLYGVYASGNLGASGTKSFAIDHPMDPENKILKHYSIESNEVLNMYRGVVTVNNSGEAIITLPDYFNVININFSYTLTSIGISSPNLFIKEEINENGQFTISGGQPNQKVSWVVYAERNDPYMQKYRDQQVDVIEKDEHERGKYIMPELYDQPEEKGMFYVPPPKKANRSSQEHNTIETKVTKVSEKEIKKQQ